MVQGFYPSAMLSTAHEGMLPLSPLFAPSGDLSQLYGRCSNATYELVNEMHEITNIVLGYRAAPQSPAAATLNTRMQQIYTGLLLRPSSISEHHANNTNMDWIDESCRLAALIYTRSLIHSVPFSNSGNVIDAHARPQSHSNHPGFPSFSSARGNAMTVPRTLATTLCDAIRKTDISDCWGDLHGLFLWLCCLGSAAVWPVPEQPLFASNMDYGTAVPLQSRAWSRRFLSLLAVKGSLRAGFGGSIGVLEALRRMGAVQSVLKVKARESSSVEDTQF